MYWHSKGRFYYTRAEAHHHTVADVVFGILSDALIATEPHVLFLGMLASIPNAQIGYPMRRQFLYFRFSELRSCRCPFATASFS